MIVQKDKATLYPRSVQGSWLGKYGICHANVRLIPKGSRWLIAAGASCSSKRGSPACQQLRNIKVVRRDTLVCPFQILGGSNNVVAPGTRFAGSSFSSECESCRHVRGELVAHSSSCLCTRSCSFKVVMFLLCKSPCLVVAGPGTC